MVDIGCGEGRTARAFARRARSVLGVDADVGAIARARRVASPPSLRFVAADALALELPPESLDVAVFSRSLGCLTAQGVGDALRRVHRWLSCVSKTGKVE